MTTTVRLDVDRLVDVEEIRQLSYRYAWGWDTGDLEMVLGVFTEDAVWDESALGVPRCTGQGEIGAAFGQLRPAISGGSLHPATNHMVTFSDPENATGVCYFLGDAVTPEGALVSAHGAFEDVYVRTDQGWRIASRVARALMPPSTGALPT
jgi:uncharacterized protein (TIGR02246 family)